jgi:hypothetical protein
MTRSRWASYELSHDTWTRGRHELERHGLLSVRRTPQGNDYDYRRLRNTYWIITERLKLPPQPAELFNSAG